MKLLFALILFASTAFSQVAPVWRVPRPAPAPTCDALPAYTDLTGLTTGNLDGQADWGATGDGGKFKITTGASGGLYTTNNADNAAYRFAIDSGSCPTSNTNQYVSFRYKENGTWGAQTGPDYQLGVALRMNAAMDSALVLLLNHYGNGTQGKWQLGVVKGGAFTSYGWWYMDMSDNDSLTVLVSSNNNFSFYRNSTLIEQITSVLDYSNGVYFGLVGIGYTAAVSTPEWYIKNFRGGNYVP